MALAIGLMTGTSMDGIDAALLETDGEDHIRDLGHISLDYDPAFKTLIHALQYVVKKNKGDFKKAASCYRAELQNYLIEKCQCTAEAAQQDIEKLALTYELTADAVIRYSTDLHRDAVQALLIKTGYVAEDIDVVGYHGQALYHQPNDGISIIVGDGQRLATELGITVVNDFRRADIQAGGQGAPFAPLYHLALAKRDQRLPAVVVNCGGISNITWMTSPDPLNLIGFDTGPGNALIDQWVRRCTSGRENFDCDGHYGLKGQVHPDLFAELYQHSMMASKKDYYTKKPPKSLDYGDLVLIEALNTLSLEDGCATLEAFTAATIVQSLACIADPITPQTWILAGGGWKNPVIRREFDTRLKQKIGNSISILTADEAGWNLQAMEAQIFAYFAVRSLQKKFLSVPGTTGVSKPMTGGFIYGP